MALSTKLKKLRTREGQSLQQVADAIGSSKAHLWELETGKSKNPSIELVTKLAEHFNMSVASLIGEDPSADKDPEWIAMYRDFKGLTKNDSETIRELMKLLRKRKQDKSVKD